MIYIGIDTSNYTASVAAVDDDKCVSKRQILNVKQGERGIRQSEGVFQHMKLLPALYRAAAVDIDMSSVCAVGVSVKPRNTEGSYMPVFLAGHGYAKVIADTLGVPLIEFSHQDGHIMAGIYSARAYELFDGNFLSVHLSGGTTEILKSTYAGGRFENEIIGGTKDISAGQYIDRVGVKLGMHFPAGKHMEEEALKTEKYVKLRVNTDGAYMSFSGVETKASRMADEGGVPPLARGVLISVAEALVKTINRAIDKTAADRVLIVGGVASNSIIRQMLCDEINGRVYFAKKEYSTDNAVGTAVLAREFTERGYGSENRNSIAD